MLVGISIHTSKRREIVIYYISSNNLSRYRIIAHSDTNDENQKYGIPELKKFPMPDAKHVRSAIKFFNYVTPAYEKQLANAILKRMREYGMSFNDFEVGEENRFSKYIPNHLEHHGVLGQRWGIRRYQTKDGTWTNDGKLHRRKFTDSYRKEQLDNVVAHYKTPYSNEKYSESKWQDYRNSRNNFVNSIPELKTIRYRASAILHDYDMTNKYKTEAAKQKAWNELSELSKQFGKEYEKAIKKYYSSEDLNAIIYPKLDGDMAKLITHLLYDAVEDDYWTWLGL